MDRETGKYEISAIGGERVRAFVPHPLPPDRPALRLDGDLGRKHDEAVAALGRLEVAATMVPSADWFLYGFVRKEAVVSSQIEGTQATLEDVVAYEATDRSDRLQDVQDVCNYVDALAFGRAELAAPDGLPLCTRLLCAVHERLMRGARGSDKQPGSLRTSQNWIGGSRPGKAHFVPPPPEFVRSCLADLDSWIHGSDPLPPIIKAGLAHVQFETVHPFLDGNGRVGRLLITLLMEHWELLSAPLLYISLGFKKRRREYYRRLDGVRFAGDWEGWTSFFLDCVRESADDGVDTARRLFQLLDADRRRASAHESATVTSMRLFERLPEQPIITLGKAIELVGTTKPTMGKAIDVLVRAEILEEITGKRRDRVYAYRRYMDLLGQDTSV